jgi:O-glycosyl hydrolase
MIRRGAHRFDSQGVLANVDRVDCENPDGQRVLVLSNTAAARPVVLQMGAMMAELTLESDSITTLTWR